MASLNLKKQARLKRKKSIKKRLISTSERPRLSVFRSAKHIYAQVIDDKLGNTMVSASSVDKQVRDYIRSVSGTKKIDIANMVGKIVAQRAIGKGIKKVVFDRNGFLYHGRIKAVSDVRVKRDWIFR